MLRASFGETPRLSYRSLLEYGLIGNHDTTALVSRAGSIDWLCLPYLDSPSVFGALLDDHHGGRFEIRPAGDFHSEQSYIPRSCVLETRFETPEGRGVLTDWMPLPSYAHPDDGTLHRHVRGIDGRTRWTVTVLPRYHYGSETVLAEVRRQGILFRGMQLGDLGRLEASVPLRIVERGRAAHAEFALDPGQEANFAWTWGRHPGRSVPGLPFPSPRETIAYWRSRTHACGARDRECAFAGPWHEMVDRSGLTLQLLTNRYAGSIAESATTSLPELQGGSRNWDYRYSWIRESAQAVQALLALGHVEESERLFQWLTDVIRRDGARDLQPVYTLDGGRYLPERELASLSGYGGARPVRVGNLSARQFQLDIYGHVLLAAWEQHSRTRSLPDGLWPLLVEIADHASQAWRRPDRGIWEVRSKPEHFVSSKVFCWVAIDRAIRLSEALGESAPRRWHEERDILHRTVCDQGFDRARNSFIRAFGERDLDAAALLIPLLGFLPADDERVQGTIDAIQRELADGVLVYRYHTPDGLPESDGAHLLCSFWLISCLALAGRVDEAGDRLAELCTFASPLGLFGEQVDPMSGNPAGNFPSAAAHLALINAALYVGLARGRTIPAGLPLIGAPHAAARPTSAADGNDAA